MQIYQIEHCTVMGSSTSLFRVTNTGSRGGPGLIRHNGKASMGLKEDTSFNYSIRQR